MIKNHTFKLISLFIIIILVVSTFTGCSDHSKHKNSVCDTYVLYSKRSCSAAAIPLDTLDTAIKETYENTGDIVYFTIEGIPRVLDQQSISEQSWSTSSQSDNILSQVLGKVVTTLNESVATTEEADPLKALHLVADMMSHDHHNTIVIADSLISTTGILDFKSANFGNFDVNAIIETLKSQSAIPNLEGAEVIISDIGKVCAPQDTLSYSDKQTLKDLWKAIFEEAGASSVEFVSQPNVENSKDNISTPFVSPVKVSENVNVFNNGVLSDIKVSFIPDQSEFMDPKTAEEILSTYVDGINASTNGVFLLGSTAKTDGDSGNSQLDFELSLKRSKKIKEVLVELGANANKIQAYGLGYTHPWRVESVEGENRCCIIIDQSSDDANTFHEYIKSGGEVVS